MGLVMHTFILSAEVSAASYRVCYWHDTPRITSVISARLQWKAL